MGVMVWGTDRICLSLARNGFWDRRGGVPFAATLTFREVRSLLETGREEELRRAFTSPGAPLPYRTPTQLPGGRMELRFGGTPVRAELDVASGSLIVWFSDGGRARFWQAMTEDLLMVEGQPESVELWPAWRWIGTQLAEGGVLPPETWDEAGHGGFLQTLPEDPALAIAWRWDSDGVRIGTALGADARDRAEGLVVPLDPASLAMRTDHWWASYRSDLPRVKLSDAALQAAWDYALFKQAGLTSPDGVAATLQGPWMAETGLPLWSNDYHFNVNAQMIYWPSLATNRPGHLRPLWDAIRDWMPELRANGRAFYGSEGAVMLPHAVDDRCREIGGFWQGTIDQACAAWLAQLAWLHYRYTLDESVLRGTAWPLLEGAFEGFWAMAETIEGAGGPRLSLPVGVSAEFGGWGRDASFQLAAFHLLARILPQAARVLGHPEDPRWARVRAELPIASTVRGARVWGESQLRDRIALWEGQDLSESHRHHSHLAGIYPFCTISPEAPATRDLVRRSLEHWSAMGPGQWVGWSMPWAALLWARCDHASAAVSLLRIWEDVFTNEGRGTLHNADSPGYSAWLHGPFFDPPGTVRAEDQMQMDAGFGVLQAICEIFVQQRGDTLHVLPSLPKQWRDFDFDGILCEGAFLAGATVREGRLCEVRLSSRAGGRLSVAFPAPLGHNGTLAETFVLETAPGETVVFRERGPQEAGRPPGTRRLP